MFRANNCLSSGGVLYKQVSVFHHASSEEDETFIKNAFHNLGYVVMFIIFLRNELSLQCVSLTVRESAKLLRRSI